MLMGQLAINISLHQLTPLALKFISVQSWFRHLWTVQDEEKVLPQHVAEDGTDNSNFGMSGKAQTQA